jgi:uncharacterized membrane protein YdjX (TVP38/TMEM64 family)
MFFMGLGLVAAWGAEHFAGLRLLRKGFAALGVVVDDAKADAWVSEPGLFLALVLCSASILLVCGWLFGQSAVRREGQEDTKSATKTFFTTKNIMAMTAAVAVMASFASVLGDKQKIRENLETAVDIIQKQGDNAMYFYLAFTLIGVVCLVPTTPMEFVGGFLFSPRYGVWMTLLYTSLAKFAANLISVLLARYVIRDWVRENIVSKFELLRLVSTAVRDEPWKMAFLVRGSMLPLSVKNYGLGVLDMPLPPIAVCSCIFTTFYAFQNIYLGSVAGDMKEAFAPKKPSSDPSDWGATVKKTFPMAFNVMLVVFLVRAVKAQIRKTKNQMEEDLKQKSEAASEADMKMGNDKPGRTRQSAVSGSAKKAQ